VTPAALFERYHLAIYRYLLRMTRRRDVAEDLAQDVFVRVLGGRGRDVLDTGDSYRAWLFRVAHNLLIDWQRRARCRSSVRAARLCGPRQPLHNPPVPASALRRRTER
jgi:RNA polymerase sigma-70 factor (ECF subfamily)